MPLLQDERLISLANDLLQQFDKVFGLHPGFRPAHAKGVMLTGTFTPADGALKPAWPGVRLRKCRMPD